MPTESGIARLAGIAPRIMVLGLDGGTFDVLAPLAAAGVMPNLAHLMHSAALAELISTEPAITPVAWTTFLTGCGSHEHGILDYRYVDHTRRQLKLNHAGRVRVMTLFDAVAQAGGSIVSLGLPMTYPARSTWRGMIVGGIDSPSPAAALAGAPRLARRLNECGIPVDLSLVWKRRPRTFEELAAGVNHTEAIFRAQAGAAQAADEMCDWRLMFVQFQTLDALQHRLWHLLGLNSDVPAPDNWVAVCRRALATLDACLGELCELAERRRAVIVAVSDHGFGPFRGGINLPELLRRRDLLAHPGLGSRIGYRVRRQFWKIGRSLWRRSRAGAKTAALSRPLEALLPIDWRRSRAMALHGNMGALIYVNSSARFGSDLVKNPRQYDQVVDESIAALVEARHPETGEALFTDAYSVASRYGQDPVRAASPDVIGIAAPGFHTRTKLSTSRSLILEDANMTGTHRREGVLMIGSPAGPVGAPIQAQLRDVAPTLAHLLGIAPMTPMTGRVIEAAFQPAAPVRQLL